MYSSDAIPNPFIGLQNPFARDADLVRASFGGDDGGFALLVERYTPIVYKFVYRYLMNVDDASDATQEVFIKAWKHLKRFDLNRNFKTWILTIAKNTALDMIKKKKPLLFSKIEEGDQDLDAFLAPYASTEELPDAAIDRQYAAMELDMALGKISHTYRMVLGLRYGEGMKFREIAEILEEPIDTIKSKHRRGIMALRKILGTARK